MKWIVSRDFEVETEVGFIQGSVDLDISGDFVEVISLGIEEKIVIQDIKDFLTDHITESGEYDTTEMRQQEREWGASEEADAWRKEHG